MQKINNLQCVMSSKKKNILKYLKKNKTQMIYIERDLLIGHL